MKRLDARGKGEVVYDMKYDILVFKVRDRNYHTSHEFRDFVIDMDDEGFPAGLRVLDASKVFGVPKYALARVAHYEYDAAIDNKGVVVRLRFVCTIRNKPVEERITQQFTAPLQAAPAGCVATSA